jgi:hypothetical protein
MQEANEANQIRDLNRELDHGVLESRTLTGRSRWMPRPAACEPAISFDVAHVSGV